MGRTTTHDFRGFSLIEADVIHSARVAVVWFLGCLSRLKTMVMNLKPETESRPQELAATTGRAPEELVEDAMIGYLAELSQVRGMLDRRYDEINSSDVKPIDGEEAFRRIRTKSEDRRRS